MAAPGWIKLTGAANLLWRTSPRSANRRELRDDETASVGTASVGTASVETANWDEDLNERESRQLDPPWKIAAP